MYNLEGIEPIIIEKELILDGTQSNYRTLKQRYVGSDFIVDEVFIYKYPTNSPAWLEILHHSIVEANLNQVQTFRTWNISNHPVQTSINRTCNLVKMEIDDQKILTTFLIKHDGEIEDRLITRIGDNSTLFELEGNQIGERDYWDILTEQGYTPYQLLDQRIPAMDNLGIFNTIY